MPVTLPNSSARLWWYSHITEITSSKCYIEGPNNEIPAKPDSEPNPCWFCPTMLKSKGE